MAIYGVGSKWDGKEVKKRFFDEQKFIIGWKHNNAQDLYVLVASLKIGDILYIKSNWPGKRMIKIKGVGIVTETLIRRIKEGNFKMDSINDGNNFYVGVAWVYKDTFDVEIPKAEGRLTNVRAATIYEEHLPVIQDAVIEKIIALGTLSD